MGQLEDPVEDRKNYLRWEPTQCLFGHWERLLVVVGDVPALNKAFSDELALLCLVGNLLKNELVKPGELGLQANDDVRARNRDF